VSEDLSVLLVTGAVGAGKTTIARAAGDLLAARGIARAVIDLDAIREFWPSPPDYPFCTALTLRNLRALGENYRVAGARRLILAGVIESPGERETHRAALGGAPLTVCRLLAPVPTLQRRVTEREDDDSRLWHVARAAELTASLDAAAVEDFTVGNDGPAPADVARTVLDRAGWLA
jgi:adenylylsulfate kinase-like enzyme